MHPFALLTGIVSVAMLSLHGASYAALKVSQPMSARAQSAGRLAAIAYVVAFIAAGLWVSTAIVGQRIVSGADPYGPSNPVGKRVVSASGAWVDNFHAHPLLWLIPIAGVLAALAAAMLLRRGSAGRAFIASSLVQAATILTAGSALFPFLLPSSSEPDHGLTVWDASSSPKTLLIMTVVVLVFLPIVLAYTAWVFHVLRGRVTLEELRRHDGAY